MSTYYALVCDKHRESVTAASWSCGGIGGMGAERVFPHFLVGHRRCTLRVVDEHQWEYGDYTDWTDENVEAMSDAAIDRAIEEDLKEPV